MPAVTLAPYLCASPAADAIEFYKRAFGAVERGRSPVPSGEIGHACLTIGGAAFYVADEYPAAGWRAPGRLDGHASATYLEVEEPDPLFARAVAAGASIERALADADYGRAGSVVDPFGHRWTIIRPNREFGAENVPR